MKKLKRDRRVKENISKKMQKWAWKLETLSVTNVNELGANLDIIETESVMEIGAILTITVNGSRNRKTIGITACATETEWLANGTESRLEYKRASQELKSHTHSSSSIFILSFLLSCLQLSLCFQSERLVSCICLGLQ